MLHYRLCDEPFRAAVGVARLVRVEVLALDVGVVEGTVAVGFLDFAVCGIVIQQGLHRRQQRLDSQNSADIPTQALLLIITDKL